MKFDTFSRNIIFEISLSFPFMSIHFPLIWFHLPFLSFHFLFISFHFPFKVVIPPPCSKPIRCHWDAMRRHGEASPKTRCFAAPRFLGQCFSMLSSGMLMARSRLATDGGGSINKLLACGSLRCLVLWRGPHKCNAVKMHFDPVVNFSYEGQLL